MKSSPIYILAAIGMGATMPLPATSFVPPISIPGAKKRRIKRAMVERIGMGYGEEGEVLSSLDQLYLDNARDADSIVIHETKRTGIGRIMSASFLITSNTVGPSMMVLPHVAESPGLLCSTALLIVVYIINLISGLLIAEVAINQYNSMATDEDVPSSFKEFADANLRNPLLADFISFVSVFVNACVLSFNLIRAGEIVVSNASITTNIDVPTVATFAAIIWASLVATQTDKRLSLIASACCFALFGSFSAMVIPGLIHLSTSDPLSIMMTPGTSYPIGSQSFSSGVLNALPVFVSTMVYQNIVPSITKILDYDRAMSTISIVLGSFIPLVMYVTFCFVVQGGGISIDLSSGGVLLNIFSTASVIGSSVACVMSIAEELDCYLKPSDVNISESNQSESNRMMPNRETASVPAVVMSVIPPLVAGILFSGGSEFVAALGACGGYGSPFLYGLIPAMLAYNQRSEASVTKELVPGGRVAMGLVGAASISLMSQQLVMDLALTL